MNLRGSGGVDVSSEHWTLPLTVVLRARGGLLLPPALMRFYAHFDYLAAMAKTTRSRGGG